MGLVLESVQKLQRLLVEEGDLLKEVQRELEEVWRVMGEM